MKLGLNYWLSRLAFVVVVGVVGGIHVYDAGVKNGCQKVVDGAGDLRDMKCDFKDGTLVFVVPFQLGKTAVVKVSDWKELDEK